LKRADLFCRPIREQHQQLASGAHRDTSTATDERVALIWVGLGISDELGDALSGNRRIDHHDALRAHDACDRRNVADEIEVEVIIERRVSCVRGADQEERIAVWGRLHDCLSPDVAACARSILDDELLTEPRSRLSGRS
jgi:hypothetical protein